MAIRQRGNTWEVRVYLGKDESGKEKRHEEGGFKSKKEAVDREIEIKNSKRKNTYIASSRLSLDTAAKQYFDTVAPNILSNYSLELAKKTYKNRFSEPLGYMNIINISTYKIQELYSKWLESGLKGSTIKKYNTLLNRIFESCVNWEEIAVNPCAKVTLPRLNKPKKQAWNIQEVQQFLKYSANHSYYIAYLLAIYTGMRESEILGLTWANTDLTGAKIQVKEQLIRTANGGVEVKKSAKTDAGERTVYLSSDLINELKIWKNQQNPSSDYVVASNKGTPVHHRNLLRSLKALCEKSGVKYISFHELRHTHATLSGQLGGNVAIISERLGHKDVSTTLNFYTHSNVEEHVLSAQNFSNFLKSKD
ncbi:site-specific integrase [Alkalibacterium sp. s-m-22]